MDTSLNFAGPLYEQLNEEKGNLQKIVTEYPASSYSRFLLLYHYQSQQDAEFENLKKNAYLYFNNPYWLQLQLMQELNAMPAAQTNNSGEVSDSIPAEIHENHVPVNLSEIADPLLNENINQSSESFNNELINSEVTDGEIPGNLIESHALGSMELSSESQTTEAETIVEEAPEKSERTEEATPFISGVENIPVEEPLENFHPESAGKFSSTVLLEESSTENSSEVETENHDEAPLEFEPLHTVDYFASQGIKFKEDAFANDRLGKQVKSFTEWLKSMKKLHPGKLPEQNEVIEQIIQSASEQSNAEANVLTEAMAEVLVKQEKHQKAIEMYEKLSLLNPAKSTYFAAKIESLKTR